MDAIQATYNRPCSSKNILVELIFTFICLCAAPLSLSANSSNSSLLSMLSEDDRQWLKQHSVIRMGIDPGYGPYSFIDQDGKVKGAALDFLELISKQLEIEFEIISSMSWQELITAIKNKNIDAIATVTYLPERTQFLAFTDSYLSTPLVVMTRNESPRLNSLEELQTKQIALVKDYSSTKKLLSRFPELTPYYTQNPKEGLEALSLSLADAYVGVLGVNAFIAQTHGIANLKVNATFNMENNTQAIGVRADWQRLSRILDKALKNISTEQRHSILNKWLPIQMGELPVLKKSTWRARLFPWLLVLFMLSLFGYVGARSWNKQLKRSLDKRIKQIDAKNLEINRLNSLVNAMLEASTDLIFMKGTEGKYLLCNQAVANLLDRPIDEIVGVTDFDLFPKGLAEKFKADDQKVIEAGKTFTYEEMAIRADGEVIPFLTTKGAIYDNSKLIGLFGISRDISEIKLAMNLLQNSLDEMENKVAERTAELEQANTKLNNVNKELETFTYSVSHDLKAPLRGIDGYSRLLLDDHADSLNEEGKLFLNNLRESSENMGQLIDDLLAYSRLERQALNHHKLALDSIFKQVQAEFKAELENVQLSIDIEPIEINTDSLALTLIIRNLLGNAIKFSAHSNPPKIHLKAVRQENMLIITLQDNGIGFEMEFHDRIFDIFQRLQRSEDYPGTGIGLAISLKAASRLGGTLRAESEAGKGATFILEIPA